MRVVAGSFRHRELVWPKSQTIRPTKDMVREALFSALGQKVINSVVLDLFAGSGALAIEALSRGAKFAYFVDHDKLAIEAIKQNLTNLAIKNAQVYLLDYQDALKKINEKIDILFLDPPYQMNDYQSIIDQVNHLLNDKSVIIIESDSLVKIKMPMNKMKEYKYGKTFVTILWK
ncbi:MAG: 16S rRNA (guanine(966)-N(2))-methyltransferase RsmD [Bacilli bacterium]|nr:16S rRNA (guanine(966)-N(2))-methyltransferase RsmD [Bacilli bacterium]